MAILKHLTKIDRAVIVILDRKMGKDDSSIFDIINLNTILSDKPTAPYRYYSCVPDGEYHTCKRVETPTVLRISKGCPEFNDTFILSWRLEHMVRISK